MLTSTIETFAPKLTCFYNANIEVKIDANHWKQDNLSFTYRNIVNNIIKLWNEMIPYKLDICSNNFSPSPDKYKYIWLLCWLWYTVSLVNGEFVRTFLFLMQILNHNNPLISEYKRL